MGHRFLSIILLVAMTRAVAAQQAAIKNAAELTEALARGDVRAVQSAFDAQVRISAPDVLAISHEVFAERRPVIRVVGLRRADGLQFQASLLCLQEHGGVKAYPIELTEHDGRIVRIKIGEGKRDVLHRDDVRVEATYGPEPLRTEARRMVEHLTAKPREETGISLPVYPIHRELLEKCGSDRQLMFLRGLKINWSSTILVRLLAETPNGVVRMAVDMTNKGTVLRWRAGDFPEEDGREWVSEWKGSNGDHIEDIVLEEVRLRLAILERDGLSQFQSLHRYTVEQRAYYDAAETRLAISEVQRATRLGLTSSTLAPLRAWAAHELERIREPDVVKIPVEEAGRSGLKDAFVVSAVEEIQLFWQNTIDKIRSLPDMAPDVTISSSPTEASFKLHIAGETEKGGTTRDTLRNVYRGLYTLQIDKADHKPCSYQVDLVNDPRTTVACTLAPAGAEGPSFCRQQ